MLEQIEAEGGDVQKFVDRAKDKKDNSRLMGFGHRVYKNYDPRAKILKKACDRRARTRSASTSRQLEIAMKLEEIALKDDYFVSHKLYPNVDFYSGIIYRALGHPDEHVHGDVRDRPPARLDRALEGDARRPRDADRASAPDLHRPDQARLRAARGALAPHPLPSETPGADPGVSPHLYPSATPGIISGGPSRPGCLPPPDCRALGAASSAAFHEGDVMPVRRLRIALPAATTIAILLVAAMAAAAPLPRLRVSDNHRFLVTADGSPFFWLGDTAWELFHRLTREDAERYLKNRADLRFTVIQAVALAEFDGLDVPNAYGERPLRRQRSRAAERGLLRARGLDRRARQRARPLRRPAADVGRQVEQEVGRRARDLHAGERRGVRRVDRPPLQGRRHRLDPRRRSAGRDRRAPRDRPRDGRGIRARRRRQRTSSRFIPTGGSGSAEPFHDDEWLDFNMRQNGHVAGVHGPLRPDARGLRPHARQAGPRRRADLRGPSRSRSTQKKHGHSIAADVRRPLYWDLFCGAFGHTYGHHSVWQFWTPHAEPVNNPLLPWTEAIDQPGAAQMQHARALHRVASVPHARARPDRSS